MKYVLKDDELKLLLKFFGKLSKGKIKDLMYRPGLSLTYHESKSYLENYEKETDELTDLIHKIYDQFKKEEK